MIAAIATACQPGQEAPAELIQFLDELAMAPDWAALAAVLRRILAGSAAKPSNGLDEIDTAVARETLAHLEQGR